MTMDRDKLAWPIQRLRGDLGERLYSRLHDAGLHTLEDIVCSKEWELWAIRGLGRTSFAKLERILANHGMAIGMCSPPEPNPAAIELNVRVTIVVRIEEPAASTAEESHGA